MDVVETAISWIVYNTRYSAYQCYDTLRVINKWGDKAPYHMTKKQINILNLLKWLLTFDEKELEEKTYNDDAITETYEKMR